MAKPAFAGYEFAIGGPRTIAFFDISITPVAPIRLFSGFLVMMPYLLIYAGIMYESA